jgi:hypothetical protein
MLNEVLSSAETDDHLIRGAAYGTVSREEFRLMIDVDRYGGIKSHATGAHSGIA